MHTGAAQVHAQQLQAVQTYVQRVAQKSMSANARERVREWIERKGGGRGKREGQKVRS